MIQLGNLNYNAGRVNKETFPPRATRSTNPRTTASSFAKVAVRRAFRISDSFTVGLSTITGTKTVREHQERAGESTIRLHPAFGQRVEGFDIARLAVDQDRIGHDCLERQHDDQRDGQQQRDHARNSRHDPGHAPRPLQIVRNALENLDDARVVDLLVRAMVEEEMKQDYLQPIYTECIHDMHKETNGNSS